MGLLYTAAHSGKEGVCMRRGWKGLAAFLSIAAILSISGSYAYFSDTLTVTNRIAVGDVDISLKEFELSEKGEIPYRNPKKVLPGDKISKIPRITNEAQPCWIRAKITYSEDAPDDRENPEGLSELLISGTDKNWVKRGEYYYYTKILERGSAVDLFREISIPSSWKEEHASQKFAVTIQADAVQARNFQPDFTAMSPWGNQEIELCVHERDGKLTCRKENVKLSVTFHGKAHKLMSVSDDFFSNFGKAMPGDTFRDTVAVSNTTAKEAEIFFRTGIKEQSREQIQMLSEMQLAIAMNGKLLYEGNLRAENMEKGVSLGSFQPGQTGKLEFVVKVPSEWKNAYALREAAVQWIFTVHESDAETKIPENTTEKTTADPEQRTVQSRKSEKVKTGDETLLAGYLLLTAGSVLIVVVAVRKRKGGRNT